MDEEMIKRRLAMADATANAMRLGKTHLERWSRPEAVSDQTLWIDRAQAAAKFASANTRVLDVGCGAMAVEPLLPEGCLYIPMDCVRRDARTVVVDLNASRFPKIGADFVFGLGVLEYIFDVPGLLRQIAKTIPEGLFSYHPLNESPRRDRLALGWVNALNEPELLVIFKASGYRTVVRHPYKKGLNFYRVSREKTDRGAPVGPTGSPAPPFAS